MVEGDCLENSYPRKGIASPNLVPTALCEELYCPCSATDRASVSGTENVGSIPARDTIFLSLFASKWDKIYSLNIRRGRIAV